MALSFIEDECVTFDAINASHLESKLKSYQKEIKNLSNLKQELHSSNVQLQRENASTLVENKQLKQQLSNYRNIMNEKDKEIAVLRGKLDNNVHHITSQYIINQQRQQIDMLTKENQSNQLQLKKYKMELAELRDRPKNFENVYDALYFLLNVVMARYDG